MCPAPLSPTAPSTALLLMSLLLSQCSKQYAVDSMQFMVGGFAAVSLINRSLNCSTDHDSTAFAVQ